MSRAVLILPPHQMLYVRSMGKLIRVTAVAYSDADANGHMERHANDALVAEFGDMRLIGDRYDQGLTIKTREAP